MLGVWKEDPLESSLRLVMPREQIAAVLEFVVQSLREIAVLSDC